MDEELRNGAELTDAQPESEPVERHEAAAEICDAEPTENPIITEAGTEEHSEILKAEPAESIENAEENNASPKSKNGIIAIVLALVIVLGAAFLAFGGNMQGPLKSKVGVAMGKTAHALSQNAFVASLKEFSESCKLNAELDLNKLSGDMLGEELEPSGSINLYVDKGFISLDAGVSLGKRSLINAAAWLTENDAVVKCDMLLDQPVGIRVSNIQNTLPKSVFAPAAGSEYALDDEAYNALMAGTENKDSLSTETVEKLSKEADSVTRELMNALAKSIDKHVKPAKEDAVIEIASEEINTKSYIYKLDEQAVKAVYGDFLEWKKNSKAYKTLMDDICRECGSVVRELYGTDVYFAVDSLNDFLENDLKNEVDRLQNLNLELGFFVNKSNGQLVRVTVSEDSENSVAFTIGPDAEAPGEISVSGRIEGESFGFYMEVRERSEERYRAGMTLEIDDIDLTLARLSWDKKDGTLLIEGDGFAFEGKLNKSGSDYVLAVDRVDFAPRSIYGGTEKVSFHGGITLTLSPSPKLPAIPEYEDILEITDEAEFTERIDEISERCSNLLMLVLMQSGLY